MSVPRTALRKVSRAAVRDALVFALIAIVNPFDIVGWSEMRSHELWEKIQAHNYPFESDAQKGPARDNISLIYFDDASVRRQSGTKSLDSFGVLDLIDDISPPALENPVAAGIAERHEPDRPVAIFVDLLLDEAAPDGMNVADLLELAAMAPTAKSDDARNCDRRVPPKSGPALSPFRCLVLRVAELTAYHVWHGDARCDQNTLARLECIRNAHGLPIIFADARRPLESDALDKPLDPTAAQEALTKVAIMSPVTVNQRDYPMVTPSDAAMRRNRRFQLYPAAALYAAWCFASPSGKCAPVDMATIAASRWPESFDAPADVVWGIGPQPAQPDDPAWLHDPTHLLATAQDPCAPAQPGYLQVVRHMGQMALSGFMKTPTACSYVRAFPSDIFQSGSFSTEDRQSLTVGKLVIIGGDFLSSSDRIPTAPYGSLPGVYLHAMVLDNLLERGAAYSKPPVTLVGAFNRYDLVTMVVIMMVALVVGIARHKLASAATRRRRGPAHLRGFWRGLGHRAAIAATAAGILLLAYVLVTASRVPIPRDVNLVAATLFAALGLLDLARLALEPVCAEIARRFRRMESILVHGRDIK